MNLWDKVFTLAWSIMAVVASFCSLYFVYRHDWQIATYLMVVAISLRQK